MGDITQIPGTRFFISKEKMSNLHGSTRNAQRITLQLDSALRTLVHQHASPLMQSFQATHDHTPLRSLASTDPAFATAYRALHTAAQYHFGLIARDMAQLFPQANEWSLSSTIAYMPRKP